MLKYCFSIVAVILLVIISLNFNGCSYILPYNHQFSYTFVKDTLSIQDEKLYIREKTYQDSLLISETEAYYYPTTKEYEDRLFYFFKTKETIPIFSVVYHGNVSHYDHNRQLRVEKYVYGCKVDSIYYNTDGDTIDYKTYYQYLRGYRFKDPPLFVLTEFREDPSYKPRSWFMNIIYKLDYYLDSVYYFLFPF
jgi:hypothetical protein